ncbi:APC amino acid permease [Coniophora puteana RWD-64-598 SS2]|uniref:APC amino acid permease n=1 Tax=Coniophora puteana (strain RWD-64-598) TaxID=741705 RepID=A0A5M3M8M4_CONPW|nr:APC amino acid permease [Coniophora puteana RWD-64-598 SS2]EIW75539.1 APC amino acid permease [Coniophora puteana RWD-64-598 SS2]
MESPSQAASSPLHHVKDVKDADEALLARIGYKQELKREFSPFEIFAVCLNVMSIVPCIASVLFNSIPNGGPVAMVWGWVAPFPFILCMALGIAELASANPTSGGLYYWTHALCSPGSRNFLSWVVGYANTIGNSTAMASVDWAFAVQVTAAASMATDGAFAATQPQTFLCIVVVVVLPAVTPPELRNSASYVFGGFTNLSGWPSGFAFILSFLAPLWTVAGYDSSVHMSEEASNAALAVPWATMCSVVAGFVLGLAVNISLAFCMGPSVTAVIVSSPLGKTQPLAEIFRASLGVRGALALWSLVLVAQFFMGASTLLVCSRQVFAFARDGALPFSRSVYSLGYWRPGRRNSAAGARAEAGLGVGLVEGAPVAAVWLVVAFALLVGLLSFAGAQAIDAVFGMAVAANYVAYIVPMAARVLASRRGSDVDKAGHGGFRRGPFHMGRWSTPVISVALAFMVFMIVVFLFPASPAASARDMNYSVAVLGGTFALVIAGYYFPVYGGVHWFRGPVPNFDAHARPDPYRESVNRREDKDGAEKGAESARSEYFAQGQISESQQTFLNNSSLAVHP